MTDEPSNVPAEAMHGAESRGMLLAQMATLKTLRTHAIAVLSVAALIAAFFGSRLPEDLDGSARTASLVAIVTFAISVLVAAVIVRPRHLSEGHALARRVNDDRIDRLTWAFSGICALVAVQVIAWAIAVTAS